MRHAAKLGWIERTDTTVSSDDPRNHHRQVRVWRSLLHAAGPARAALIPGGSDRGRPELAQRGIERIVERHVLDAFAVLSLREQTAAALCLPILVSTGLLAAGSGPPPRDAVLNKLSRTFMVRHDQQRDLYKLYHPILAVPILDWCRRHEVLRKARRRLVAVVCALVALGAVIGGVAWWLDQHESRPVSSKPVNPPKPAVPKTKTVTTTVTTILVPPNGRCVVKTGPNGQTSNAGCSVAVVSAAGESKRHGAPRPPATAFLIVKVPR